MNFPWKAPSKVIPCISRISLFLLYFQDSKSRKQGHSTKRIFRGRRIPSCFCAYLEWACFCFCLARFMRTEGLTFRLLKSFRMPFLANNFIYVFLMIFLWFADMFFCGWENDLWILKVLNTIFYGWENDLCFFYGFEYVFF
jgi:hypothetical protein